MTANATRATRILITGATAGIGRAAALHFAERGMQVFATGRNVELLDALEKEVGDPARLRVVRLDVNDLASIEAAETFVAEATAGEGLDALVNNAGYGLLGPISEVTDAQMRAQFDTNVFGLLNVTRAFLPAMIRRRAGRIVNVGSVAGRITTPFMGAYNASKYAVEAISDALRMELQPLDIQVAIVEPGPIKTAFTGTAMSGVDAQDRAGSPYRDILAESDKLTAKFDGFSAPVDVVTRAIHEAVTSASPKARYVVPGSFATMLWATRFVPTSLVDAIQRKLTGIQRKRIVPPPAATE
jgi:short-subunit dehydrogenase